MAVATFGAGCFWGVEYFFREVNGVTNATCGYMGGRDGEATYEQVKQGSTGHAEVVRVEFDPAIVSFETLLDIFWSNHNPTTLNQQGDDIGEQYRSTIFYCNVEQQQQANESKNNLIASNKWQGKPIVTQIVAAQTFYRAEEYHQQYLAKNNLPSCHISF
ncbi:peptide-methionine (S)-S-oxide reductase MsrA [Shewanella intestini]|uniref:Peptide methionine sulfoxide reductase MsrA n=1 Tax=Shewanella intestini TaxID=2017544 RepID=A0ABS5I1N2_9GAMM|nr:MULTISPECIES: peptide-methionine (S)-S-oxide reductase MsrA [Shewanella]MBR9727912.1 peptide-methionine (S)-S-oxide reductase MsrA [Shewanella intestini]MRG36095.1 peptide-methionine (S)-S-oxide reductase MsrA [Shewanella sp. XMDDZSB0408]